MYVGVTTTKTHDQKSQQMHLITARSTSSVPCSINHRTKYQLCPLLCQPPYQVPALSAALSTTVPSTSSVRCSVNHRTKYQLCPLLCQPPYQVPKHYSTVSKQCKFTDYSELLNYHLQPKTFHCHVYPKPLRWPMSVQQCWLARRRFNARFLRVDSCPTMKLKDHRLSAVLNHASGARLPQPHPYLAVYGG
jgi:hypothetical protein